MATEAVVKKIEEVSDKVLAFDTQQLRTRSEWGELNFEEAENNLKRIFAIAAHLKTLPLEFLPEDIANVIHQHVNSAVAPLEALDSFDIKQADPVGQVNARTTAIQTVADAVYKHVTPWIPFLAYQEGDVAKNINRLTVAVTDGRTLVEDAKQAIEVDKGEMAKIIQQARDASAAAGAAVFTQEFKKESKEQNDTARTWLKITVSLAALSLLSSVGAVLLNYMYPPASWLELGPKFFVLALLLTSTLWSGRIYKAFMHQAAVNKHRSLALQTFQAFSDATDDVTVKNAVLLEATHSIFGPSASGFLGDKGTPDSASKIVEIMKTIRAE